VQKRAITGGNDVAKKRRSVEFKRLVDDLVSANHILFDQDIFDGFGHISFRDPDNSGRFHMSRALAPGRVTPRDILEYALDGEPVDGAGQTVYVERFIHSEVYRARNDVMAVVHSHSPTVIPFSVTEVPFKPIRAAFLYPEVPIFEIRDAGGWTNLLVTSPALGAALAKTLGGNTVALMRGHGNVVVAPTLQLAVSRAIKTEMDARLLLQAKLLGGPINYLAPEEAEKIEAMAASVKRGSEQAQDRTWEMWKEQAARHLGRPARTTRRK
jgi:ribulose-5-phosphate 4-epimerase/fuculose-1-phosphate aldolase